MSPSIKASPSADKLGAPAETTPAQPHQHPHNTYHYHAEPVPTAVPVPPASPCQCCNNAAPSASPSRRTGNNAVTFRSPFVFSGFVGFAGMALCKNLFFLTSTVGVTALTLVTLGKQGIVEVDWKKLEDKFRIPDASNWTFTVPSKAGLFAGMFVAWKFFA